MIEITSLKDIRENTPAPVAKYIRDICRSLDSEYQDENFSFGFLFGGNFFLCETDEDLDKVEMLHWMFEPKKESIRETADNFDVAQYIEDGSFAVLCICTNNAGGNTYLVARALSDKYPTINESIERMKA